MQNTSEIRRPRQINGRFEVLKSGRGKNRVRVLTFTTYDGHTGHSAEWNHDAAYDAAVAKRAAALMPSAPAVDTPKPAPAAQLLRFFHNSSLFAEIERRGYAVVVPDETGPADRGVGLPTRRFGTEVQS